MRNSDHNNFFFIKQIQADDPLPKNVCLECFNKIAETYKFLQQCLNAEQELRDYMTKYNEEQKNSSKKKTGLDVINETHYESMPDSYVFNEGHVSSATKVFESPNVKNSQSIILDQKPAFVKSLDFSQKMSFDESTASDVFHTPESKSNESIVTDLDDIDMSTGPVISSTPHPIKRTNSKKQYKCIYQTCNAKFDTKSLRRKHLEEHLIGSNLVRKSSIWKCQHCGAFFQNANQLLAHEKSHAPQVLFECEICLKKFKNKVNLQAHQLTHATTETHKCDVCFKEFSHISTLYVHQVIHRSGVKEALNELRS